MSNIKIQKTGAGEPVLFLSRFPLLILALAAQVGNRQYRGCYGSACGCRQYSEAVLIGCTSTVKSQMSLPMFMSTEIKRHAKSGLFLLHCLRALDLAPESCVTSNG